MKVNSMPVYCDFLTLCKTFILQRNNSPSYDDRNLNATFIGNATPTAVWLELDELFLWNLCTSLSL